MFIAKLFDRSFDPASARRLVLGRRLHVKRLTPREVADRLGDPLLLDDHVPQAQFLAAVSGAQARMNAPRR